MKSRIFNIMQYEKHPNTGEPLLNEDQIKIALSHKTIKRWAYVAHDKDHYSDKDFDDDPNHTIDMVKPKHWHIVLECSQQLEVHTIARWFGIPENFVDCPKGAGAFLDCVEYLTHENPHQQELDKYRYGDDEIKASAGFDFRNELDKRAERLLRYGKDVDERGAMIYDILHNGMTLNQAYKRNAEILSKNYNEFARARGLYLKNMDAPAMRINFYVWSKNGGDGKGLASRALARSFFPGKEDDEIFFNLTNDTKFNGYDGQPVIIWNDFRAYDLIKVCGSRGALFDIFDSHPVKQTRDVKYSTINLVNTINIVNSVQPYREFLDGLAGEYADKDGNVNKVEDKGQAYRRFPCIVEVKLSDYDFLINRGFIGDSKSYEEYEVHKNIKAGFKAMNEMLGASEELVRELETKALNPVVNKVNTIIENQGKDKIDREEALKLFGDVGTQEGKTEIENVKKDDFPW